MSFRPNGLYSLRPLGGGPSVIGKWDGSRWSADGAATLAEHCGLVDELEPESHLIARSYMIGDRILSPDLLNRGDDVSPFFPAVP